MTDETEPKKKAGTKDKVPTVTRKELAVRVQKATGAKLKDVQTIVLATLTVMNNALKAGEHLRLPPFGAARVVRPADTESGQTMRVALREVKERPKAERPARVKPEKPAKAARPAKAAKPAAKAANPQKAAKAAKTRARRAGAAKQTLAATGEAE